MNLDLTREQVRQVLDYNPANGVFYWKSRTARCVVIGAQAGSVEKNGYLRIQIGKTRYLAHRLAWLVVYGEWPSKQIDHVDGSRSNNAIANLRLATASENRANSKMACTNKSGLKGVFCVQGRWIAAIKHQGKSRHLGCFDTADRAHLAYEAAAKSLFGNFARAA